MQEINHKHTGQSTAHSTGLYMRDVIATTGEGLTKYTSFDFTAEEWHRR